MNKLLLCEGKTDVIFISNYLKSVSNWLPAESVSSEQEAFIAKRDSRMGESMEWYVKDDAFLLICAVGGKDKFKSFIQSKIIPAVKESNFFSRIAIVTDRDDREELSICNSFETALKPIITEINSNTWVINSYTDGFGQNQSIDFMLLIVPHNDYGALETVFINAIAEDDYNKSIVDKAKIYIDDVGPSASKYIGKAGRKLKAWFNVIWATIYPEKTYLHIGDRLHPEKWVQSNYIEQCFSKLTEI